MNDVYYVAVWIDNEMTGGGGYDDCLFIPQKKGLADDMTAMNWVGTTEFATSAGQNMPRLRWLKPRSCFGILAAEFDHARTPQGHRRR